MPGIGILKPDTFNGYGRIKGAEELWSDGIMQRHFLFSALHAGALQCRDTRPLGFDWYFRSEILRNSNQESLVMYDSIRESGITPLGPEEVYGMMSSAILGYIERHPEADFRELE
jgi:hypothetical protein